MKKIAIVTRQMIAGGIEKALISMLEVFPKDKFEMSQLINYFENNDFSVDINVLSVNTGISEKNLNRYLDSDIINLTIEQ